VPRPQHAQCPAGPGTAGHALAVWAPGTIDELTAAAVPRGTGAADDEINAKLDDCGRRLTQYRAALDTGADPASVAQWITQTEAGASATTPPSVQPRRYRPSR
jgi:hypothetical protein